MGLSLWGEPYKRSGSSKWWIRRSEGGNYVDWESTGTADRKLAERVRREWNARILLSPQGAEAEYGPDPRAMTVPPVAAAPVSTRVVVRKIGETRYHASAAPTKRIATTPA